MSDPRELHVIGKKPEVADRTLNERKYCAIDDYYYSEMFTCPICYGAERERERIIKLLQSKLCSCLDLPDDQTFADREELMKHMNCDWQAMQIEYHVALIKGEQK